VSGVIDLYVWVGIFVLAVIIEIGTLGLTTIWFTPGSLLGIVLAACGVDLWIQITAFIVISVIMLLFTRPIAVKYVNDRKIKTNVETIVGSEAIVTEQISNIEGKGIVIIGGIEWSARTESNDDIIEKDARVIATAVEGVKVIVKRKGV